MQLKNSFMMIIFFLAANILAAQEAYVIYEGTQLNYRVDLNEGNTYAWEVLNGLDPPTNANTGDYGFITNPNLANVGIQWNLAGQYVLTVTETDASGCSNKKALAVQVQSNLRSIGFDVVASTECFNLSGNGFQLPVLVADNSGAPLSAAYFPLSVQFTVNGSTQSQLVSYDNEVLQINETMFTANPGQNTSVEVAIISVTDSKNAPIQPGILNGTHLRTIFAIPEIEFTEELRKKYNLKHEETTAFINNDSRRMERMEPE